MTSNLSHVIQMSVQKEKLFSGFLIFEYRPSCNTLTSGIPAFFAHGIHIFRQPEIATFDNRETILSVKDRRILTFCLTIFTPHPDITIVRQTVQ